MNTIRGIVQRSGALYLATIQVTQDGAVKQSYHLPGVYLHADDARQEAMKEAGELQAYQTED